MNFLLALKVKNIDQGDGSLKKLKIELEYLNFEMYKF